MCPISSRIGSARRAFARARQRAAKFLTAVPARAQNDVLLALNELVTNAIRHGEGAVRVEVRRSGDHVRLEVTDDGDAAPEVRKEPADASGGWGLRIVEAVSSRWG